MEEKKFQYVDCYSNSHEITLTPEDFELVQKDKKIHDLKFKNKPTTFFRDSLKRFLKNKSSVAGGVILFAIVFLAIIVPFCGGNVDSFNINSQSAVTGYFGIKSRAAIAPKLFPAGTGFWDGTQEKKEIVFNQDTNEPVGYPIRSVSKLETWEVIDTIPGEYGKGGEAILTYTSASTGSSYYDNPANYHSTTYNWDFIYDYTIEYVFSNELPSNYSVGQYRISLVNNENGELVYYPLTGDENLTSGKTGYFQEGFVSNFSSGDEAISINVSEKMKTYNIDKLDDAYINIDVSRNVNGEMKNAIAIKSLSISSTSDPNKDDLAKRSIKDGNSVLIQAENVANENNTGSVKNVSYWSGSNTSTAGNNIKYVYCNFVYDQYEDIFGVAKLTIDDYKISEWVKSGIISFEVGGPTIDQAELASRIKILKPEECPIVKIYEQIGTPEYDPVFDEYYNFQIVADCSQYKMLGYDSMPSFIFGTDRKGRDFCKVIFNALRTSLLLAIFVSAVNIIFGLIWGSISGYYGGWTDIVMERFCDILSGIPSIAIITLCILYMNNDMVAFLLAMFLTGWMGVSSRTRTQFYRFKGREYVLASRSLGARDSRLVFRHILPNSLGTIITSSILMIPSVIYSEASIAYLNLGLSSEMMFGVILSENRSEFNSYTVYLLVIPTFIMLLLLIAFNLFGNGLRDAFNPQLKGSE